MSKLSMARLSLINKWLRRCADKCFTTDGAMIFCQACEKYLACDRHSQLTQHMRTAIHQENISDEAKWKARANSKAAEIEKIRKEEEEKEQQLVECTGTGGGADSCSSEPISTTDTTTTTKEGFRWRKHSDRITSKSLCFICCSKLISDDHPDQVPNTCVKLNSKSLVQLMTPFFVEELHPSCGSYEKLSTDKPITATTSTDKKYNYLIRDQPLLDRLSTDLKQVDYCGPCSGKLMEFLAIVQQLRDLQSQVYTLRKSLIGSLRKQYTDWLAEDRELKGTRRSKGGKHKSGNRKKLSAGKKSTREHVLRGEIVKGISAKTPSNSTNFPSHSTNAEAGKVKQSQPQQQHHLTSAYVKLTPLEHLKAEHLALAPAEGETQNQDMGFSFGLDHTELDEVSREDPFSAEELSLDVKPDLSLVQLTFQQENVREHTGSDSGAHDDEATASGSDRDHDLDNLSSQEDEDSDRDPDYSPPSGVSRSQRQRLKSAQSLPEASQDKTPSPSSAAAATTATAASAIAKKYSKQKGGKTKKKKRAPGRRWGGAKSAKRPPKFLPPFQCPHCQKIFPRRQNLKQHMNLHLQPYACKVCQLRFSWRPALLAHEALSHPELGRPPPPVCKICGKTYATPQALTIHMNSVHQAAPKAYICHSCPYACSLLPNLTRHIRIVHDKVRDFSCATCGALFSRRRDLSNHELKHTGEKPHACTICGKRFRMKDKCQVHQLTHGGGVVKYSCHVCGKGYTIRNYLYYHLRTHRTEGDDGYKRRRPRRRSKGPGIGSGSAGAEEVMTATAMAAQQQQQQQLFDDVKETDSSTSTTAAGGGAGAGAGQPFFNYACSTAT